MLPSRFLSILPRLGIRQLADSKSSQFPVANILRKDVNEIFDQRGPITKFTVEDEQAEAFYLSGVPKEKAEERFVRIYQPVRSATQSGWSNTRCWKIDFGEYERWENPMMGWCSTGDPLSNIQMTMTFGSKEDAIRYCTNNHFKYEIAEPYVRTIRPKTYAENFSWNKRTRIRTK